MIFRGGWWDNSPGPQKNCQLKPPPKVKLGVPMPKDNNEILQVLVVQFFARDLNKYIFN
jgi:hypothetical protein